MDATLLRGAAERAVARGDFMPELGVINYELLWRRPDIAALPWRTIVCDESTDFRNPKSKVAKFLTQWPFQAERRAILSGSPDAESKLDYFTQMKFLFGHFMGYENFYQWRNRYFQQAGFDWRPRPGTLEAMKAELDLHASTLTRAEAGIKTPKVYQVRRVELPSSLRQLYRQAERDFLTEGGREAKHAPVVQSYLRQIVGGLHPDGYSLHKVNELLKLLKGELRGQQGIVWCQFVNEVEELARVLRAAGFRAAPIWGDVKPEARREVRHRFQRGELDIVVCQTRCARYGLDFSRGSFAVYWSNPWENLDRIQSEDRIIHSTKSEPALIIDLLVANTVEEDVRELLLDKRAESRLFMSKLRDKLRSKARC